MKKYQILSGNQLKLLALITMTIDHVGSRLFPQIAILRIIGRLAYPIFAYMIAEGCHYTKNRTRYLLTVLGLGVCCQLIYIIAFRNFYCNILLTFSLSIATIYLLEKKRWYSVLWMAFVAVVTVILPTLLSNIGFVIDYGFMGVLVPVLVYFAGENKLLAMLTGLLVLSASSGGIEWYSLFALIPLALYNGKRGKWKLKYLFYVYYPAHLFLIYVVYYFFFRK